MIGVIADDLTGAAEIGAVGLRHGFRAEIIQQGRPSAWADIVCVDTDSRSCPPEAAADKAAAAALLLREAGAKWIYKKVDSVLRGQVTAEVEAVMKQLDCRRALLLPANPSLGRTIKNGRYFVRGRPLHQTEFARDPQYPRRSSQVLQLLRVPEHFQLRLANGERSVKPGTILVGEAQTAADVDEWAEVSDAGTLRVGGAEFFNALLAAEKPAATDTDAFVPRTAGGRELFVCGTSTQSSRKFVAAQRRAKIPVIALPLELRWGAEFTPAAVRAVAQRAAAAFAQNARVILAVGFPQISDFSIARRLSQHLVEIAVEVLGQTQIAGVFAEGGATAAELVRRMGWSRLTVLQELAPGVATLAVGDKESIVLTIKPGTYAWPAKWT